MRYYFSGELEKILEIEKNNDSFFMHSGDEKKEISLKEIGDDLFYKKGNQWKKVIPLVNPNSINIGSENYQIFRGFKPSGSGGGDFGSLVTQMPGKVVKILKKNGDEVKQGETLLILEAMKMENEIKAGIDGVIESINVSEGDNIESGHVMIELDIQE